MRYQAELVNERCATSQNTTHIVIPAKAGIQETLQNQPANVLGPSLRWDDSPCRAGDKQLFFGLQVVWAKRDYRLVCTRLAMTGGLESFLYYRELGVL